MGETVYYATKTIADLDLGDVITLLDGKTWVILYAGEPNEDEQRRRIDLKSRDAVVDYVGELYNLTTPVKVITDPLWADGEIGVDS